MSKKLNSITIREPGDYLVNLGDTPERVQQQDANVLVAASGQIFSRPLGGFSGILNIDGDSPIRSVVEPVVEPQSDTERAVRDLIDNEGLDEAAKEELRRFLRQRLRQEAEEIIEQALTEDELRHARALEESIEGTLDKRYDGTNKPIPVQVMPELEPKVKHWLSKRFTAWKIQDKGEVLEFTPK